VKAYRETTVVEGKKTNRVDVVVRVVRDADEKCRDGSCETSWEIAVGPTEAWEDGKLAQDGLVELYARIGARDGAITLHDSGQQTFLDVTVWRTRRLEQHRAQRLIMATPEWNAQSRLAARTPGKTLGLVPDPEPSHCAPNGLACRWSFTALSVCAGCAGHWVRFDMNAANDTLFVGEMDEQVAYGMWRSSVRHEQVGVPEYAELLDAKEHILDPKPGNGPLGYGTPSSVVTDMANFHHPTRAVIEEEGLRLVRIERYEKRNYPVFFVEASGPFPIREKADAFRAFAAKLVRKNGSFACELSIGPKGDRYQLDRHAETPHDGGVYVLIDGAFHPWIGG
jgi:hypothetical protein